MRKPLDSTTLPVAPAPKPLSSRLDRELKTIIAMVRIYCRRHHAAASAHNDEFCAECRIFVAYARQRLSHCPYGDQKPTCGNCPIHCYKKSMQDQAQKIMRYSGPKMAWRHPLMAYFHLIDSRKKPPPRDKSNHQI